MRLLIAACLFAISFAQTDPDDECNVLSFQGGMCDDPVGVDLVFVLDADLSATSSEFQNLRGYALGLLSENFNPSGSLKSGFSFGLVLIDNEEGTVVRMQITTILDFNLEVSQMMNTLSQPASSSAPDGSMVMGIEKGLDMLEARPDVNQAKVLVVIVDADTIGTTGFPAGFPCTGYEDLNTRLSALTSVMFVTVGIPDSNGVQSCFLSGVPESQYAKPSGYSMLLDADSTNEENLFLCGDQEAVEYFGDYSKTADVDQSGTTYFSFEKADDSSKTLVWNSGTSRWQFSGGADLYYPSSDAPIPAYKGFWRLGGFHDYRSKCYFPPTSSPTAEPSKEPTKIPTKYPTFNPSMEPTKEPSKNPTEEPSGFHFTIETCIFVSIAHKSRELFPSDFFRGRFRSLVVPSTRPELS